jgi:hypothetical protein
MPIVPSSGFIRLLIYAGFVLLVLVVSQSASAQGVRLVRPPDPLPVSDLRPKIFLGGSIEMGSAVDWQSKLAGIISDLDVVLLNPRRNDWDTAWKPVAADSNFRAQVEWELTALEASDLILIYFAPGTLSPVSLLEFGLYAGSGKLRVVCPDGFWRKGNVDITAARYGVPVYNNLDEFVQSLRQAFSR